MEVGLVDSSERILLTRESQLSSQDITPIEMLALIKSHITDMLNEIKKTENCTIKGIGICCPGQVNGDILVAASNFPKFNNVPFVRLVSEAFAGAAVALLNDADAAVSAEVWGNPDVYSKYQNLAMITLGTGIGCGLILDGQLFHGSNGIIEAGHMIVTNSPQSRPCGCGQKGCVEAYSSAKSTVKRLQEMDLLDKNSSSTVVDGKDVFQRYLLNDFNAVKVVEETAEHLAVLSINICRVIDPQVIVFGGGLSKAGNVLLDLIRKYVREKTWTVLPTDVRLTLAISDKGGVLGAALAAKQKAIKSLQGGHKTEPSTLPNTGVNKQQEEQANGDKIEAWNNIVLGACVVASSASIFLLSKGRSPDRSSLASYLYDLLIIGQFGVGVALLLRR